MPAYRVGFEAWQLLSQLCQFLLVDPGSDDFLAHAVESTSHCLADTTGSTDD